jgi:hypothetical protein
MQKGLSVLMPSEVSTIGGDQSGEELRRELAEAREQQAATAEILAAVSNSPTDPSRVFEERRSGPTLRGVQRGDSSGRQ